MKTLIKLLNSEKATEEEAAGYAIRTAARPVVYDNDGNVALMNVSKYGYHKLPGGGIEEGEDELTALRGECREKIGCEIEVFGEVGQIVEYRKMFKIKQISFCYLAKVAGEKGTPSFTQGEIDIGFRVKWLPPEQALQLLSSDRPQDEEGKLYIVPRDKILLEEALKIT